MTAADIALALNLQPAGRGVWRGPCPLCTGSRRFQVKQGHSQVLVHCWAGCKPEELLRTLRERGLLESRALTPEDRKRMAAEKRAREEAQAFAQAARLLCDAALERMPSTDPRRADVTQLRLALEHSPEAEAAWFKQNRPEMFRALLYGWSQQQKRWRRRAARLVEAAAVEAEVTV